MKKTIMILAIAVMACSKTDSNSSESSDVADKVSKALDETLGESVGKYDGKLDELLTLEMAAKAFGYEAEEAEKEYKQTLDDPEYHSVSYNWKKGRTMTIKNDIIGTMELPADDYVTLSYVRQGTYERFKNTYRNISPEEREAGNKAMKKELEKKVKEGEITSDQAEMATGLGSGISKGISFIDIPDVGELAVWDNPSKELKVYYKGLEFRIGIESTKGREADIEIATVLAKEIIKDKL